MRVAATIVLVGALAGANTPGSDANRVYVMRNGDISAWQTKSFSGETHYRRIADHGREVLRARSVGSASGLIRRIRVDLNRTPYLHWSWRVRRFPYVANERKKAGDDFAARIYVVVSGGLAFWETKALDYVWAQHVPAGTHWPNPFTSNTMMLAVRSGDKADGTWHRERRNVKADLHHLLGLNARYIDAVAIMTDADNSDSQDAASYGNIYFSTH